MFDKLTIEQREAIARDTRPGHVIAREYGVSESTVSRVKRAAGTALGRDGRGQRRPGDEAEPSSAKRPLSGRHYRASWDAPDGRTDPHDRGCVGARARATLAAGGTSE